VKTVWIFRWRPHQSQARHLRHQGEHRLVNIVRTRVEYNKRRKGIYEITNR
jgi:hypothetical protein